MSVVMLRETIRAVLDLRSSVEADRGNDVALVGNGQARRMLQRALDESDCSPEPGALMSRGTVAAYLDESIRYWRGLGDGTLEPTPPLTAERAVVLAPIYVDAFQSARVSLLGELLP